MNLDKFSDAGDGFRDKAARDFSARDQAIARLTEIEDYCRDGIGKFYEGLTGSSRSDVYVNRYSEQQVSIRFGLRPARDGRVLKGPMAVVFVTPTGATLYAKDPPDWMPCDSAETGMGGLPLNTGDWQDAIADWIIEFIQEAEEAYERINYQDHES